MATRLVKDLESMSCKEQLKELRPFSLGKRRVRGEETLLLSSNFDLQR